MAVRLEDLTAGALVRGIDPAAPVTLVSATMAGAAACTVVYRTESGDLRETVLFRDKEPLLDLDAPAAQFSFTADPDLFRLASEARRIRLAYLFDPMQAVFTSPIQPLPHQIRAVYEALRI